MCELYLWHKHTLMCMFYKRIQVIEGANNSVAEVLENLELVHKVLLERKNENFMPFTVKSRDLEAVEFLMLPLPAPLLPSSLLLPHLWNFLLPLPAPDRASRFRFQSFPSKRFRFHKNLTASAPTSLLSMKQLIVLTFKKKAGKFIL